MDITQVGDATLICGGCMKVLPTLEDERVRLILADPPFGTTSNTWDKVLDMDAIWPHIRRVRTPAAATLLFAQQPFASDLIRGNRREYRYEWIYCKRNPVGFFWSHHMPLRAHELILTFYARLPTYNPQMQSGGKPYVRRRRKGSTTPNYHRNDAYTTISDGRRYPTDVLSGFEMQRGAHPTQKPTDLLAYLIRTYTDPGDMVLDFCMGSGSTCVAALEEGRRAIGIELDRGYYDTAVRRCREALKRKDRQNYHD